MRAPIRCVYSCALACACGPESRQAELDEVCGEASPFRLLELDAGERLVSARRIGERYWLVIGDDEASRVVSMEECGDDPIEVARDVYAPFEHERWPGRVLACTERYEGAMVVLDPTGVDAPRVVMEAPGCRGTPTDHGIVGVVERDDETNTLALVPYPDDLDGPASAAIVLADRTRGEPFLPQYAVRGDDVFVVDDNQDLVRIALPSGEIAVEQPAVGEWGITADATVLAWRDYDPAIDPTEFAIATIQLRNRIDARTLTFDAVQFLSGIPLSSERYLGLRGGTKDAYVTQLVDLETFETRELPGDLRVWRELSDGRLLTSNGLFGRLSLLDLLTGEATPLADVGSNGWHSSGDDDAIIRASSPNADETPIWRVPLDGSAATKLAHRVSRLYWFELVGRIVTPIDVVEDDIGDLVEIDPDSLDERMIDHDVQATVMRRGEPATFHERDILYAVDDAERSGVWVARLGVLD